MNARTKELLSFTFLSAWLIISVIIFAAANRVSYIQAFVFPDWLVFGEQLRRIAVSKYLFDLFFSLVGVVIFSMTCMGLGLSILNRLKIPSVSIWATGTTAFLTGEILFSLLFLTVISTLELTPARTAVLLILGFVSGLKPLWHFAHDIQQRRRADDFGGQPKDVFILTISILVLSLLLSSARLGYDAVSDYFSQAKLMAVSHASYSFFPGNSMIVSSLHPDILFTALMQIFGDQSARMLAWVNGMAIILMGLAIAEEAGLSSRARKYFLVLMITSTAFVDLLGDGKVELITTAPILAAVYWMLYSLKKSTRGVLLLIGFLAGFAIIARLYNIFLVSLFVATFYLFWEVKKNHLEKHRDLLTSFKMDVDFALPILWMLPTLLMMGAFHLWQNWLWLGSPLAPLLFAQNLKEANWAWQFEPETLNTLRALYPFTVTFFNTPQSLGNITPLFVGFLPFFLVRDIRKGFRLAPNLNYLLLVVICTLIPWIMFFYTVVEIRYAMFLWTVLFMPAAQLIEYSLDASPVFFAGLLRLLMVVLLGFTALRTLAIALVTYSPIDADGRAYCFDFKFCTFFETVNQTAAPGDRVFALNAHRYYLRPDLFACSSRSNEYQLLQDLALNNSPDFWVEVYRQGYHFLTYEENFSVFFSHFGTIPDPTLAPAWLKISIGSRSGDNKDISYRIEAENPPYKPRISCRWDETREVWQLIYSSP